MSVCNRFPSASEYDDSLTGTAVATQSVPEQEEENNAPEKLLATSLAQTRVLVVEEVNELLVGLIELSMK